MALFIFDNTFEGLLTSVFEAYSRRTFPDALLAEGEPLPLFCDETFTVVSDEEKAGEGLAWLAEKNFLHPPCLVLRSAGWRKSRKLHRFCSVISVRQ